MTPALFRIRGLARLALLPLLLNCGVPASFAAFQDMRAGARPLGMGGAFTAVADDANAAGYNPAGLVSARGLELLAMYGKLYSGLTDGSNLYSGTVAAVYPVAGYGTVGAGWNGLGLTGMYQENDFRLSYGNYIPKAWAEAAGVPALSKLAVGVNADILQVGLEENDFTRTDPAVGRYSQVGFSLDAGFLYEILPGLKAGLAVRNILEPDLTLTRDDVNRLPLETALGAAYVWPELDRLLSTLEASYQRDEYRLRLGLEKWFLQNTLGARTGLGFGQGAGSRDYGEFAAGLSYGLKTPMNYLTLDYAFIYPINGGIMGTLGTHWLSLLVRW